MSVAQLASLEEGYEEIKRQAQQIEESKYLFARTHTTTPNLPAVPESAV